MTQGWKTLGLIFGTLALLQFAGRSRTKTSSALDTSSPDRVTYSGGDVPRVSTWMRQNVLDVYQDKHGYHPRVHSGNRTKAENKAAGGSDDSSHLVNRAVDVSDPMLSSAGVVLSFADILPEFDQLIAYSLPKRSLGGRGGHTHVGMGDKMRGDILVAPNGTTKVYADPADC